MAYGRWNLVLAALLAILSAAALLTVDPRSLTQAGGLPALSVSLSFPYLLIVLMVALCATRAAAWISVIVALIVLLAAVAATVISEGDALAVLAYFGPLLSVLIGLCVAAHLTLLFSAISLLRGGAGGGSALAIILSLGLLGSAIFVFANLRRYAESPERAEAIALDQEVTAVEIVEELNYCLGLHHRQHDRYPAVLMEIGPQGSKCARAQGVSNSITGYDVRYSPTARGYELRMLAKAPERATHDSYRSDETGTLYHSTDGEGNGGAASDHPEQDIQMIDICLEQYRLDHPQEGYPPALEAAQERMGCYSGYGLVSGGRLILEFGTHEGYRYQYTPLGAPGAPHISSFRLDVRPIAYGQPLTRSLLCTPEGTLHVTEEDRAAKKTDPDMQMDTVTGTAVRSYCMGPDVPARSR